MKKWVSIEGLIGAGKTTFIEKVTPYLEEHFGAGSVVIVKEPVDRWHEYLSKFSQDPVRYSFLFQVFAFHTRQEEFNKVYRENPDATIFISERSPLTDRHVFWKTNCQLHPMDSLEETTYPMLWETWNSLYPLELNHMVYLDLNPRLCNERVLERNRTSEKGSVTENYQTMLEGNHRVLFEETSVPHTVLSSEQNYRDDPNIAQELAQKIIEIII